MQQLDIYLRADSVKATITDMYNNAVTDTTSITRGMKAEFILHLFHSQEEDDVFTAADFEGYTSWAFYADSDYNQETTPKLAVTEGIYVDGDGCIHIPIEETNTEELADYLGTSETKSLTGEIVGVKSGEDTPGFILQWGFEARNRVGGLDDSVPVEVAGDYYTRSEVNALLTAGYDVEYSADGEAWADSNDGAALYIRFKNSAMENAEWTVATLTQGPKGEAGEAGEADHLYVAYASDAEGSDFSLAASADLKYRAEFHDSEVIESPALEDFQSHGAQWIKCLGDDGSGGDMYRSEYVDAGGAGVVLSASSAASVAQSNIADGARQVVFSDYAPTELYIDKQIIEATSVVSTGEVAIAFNKILATSGGEAYQMKEGDCFTWEYQIHAAAAVDIVTIGGEMEDGSSSLDMRELETEDIPGQLPRLGADTIHAFAVRARYSEDATSNCSITVNYMYSTEG